MTYFVNVFTRQDRTQVLGAPHVDEADAKATMGPPGKWFWGMRPVCRLRVTLKAGR